MRTSFHYQPEAQHPNSSAIHKPPADYPIFCGYPSSAKAVRNLSARAYIAIGGESGLINVRLGALCGLNYKSAILRCPGSAKSSHYQGVHAPSLLYSRSSLILSALAVSIAWRDRVATPPASRSRIFDERKVVG